MAVLDRSEEWATGRRSPRLARAVRRPSRPDPFELLVLALFAALSMWVVAVNLSLAATHHLVWTGIDGEFPVDQLQYLAWVRDAARHFFVSDLFVLGPTPHDYLQPMIAVSGGLTALGVAPWLSILIWKPVAVVAVFFAVRAYCRRLLVGRWERRAALALALFATSYGTFGDAWLPFLSWGYLFALASVAAMVGALVLYDRGGRSWRSAWLAPALALLASWLHPWQGELVIILVISGELLVGRESHGRRMRTAITAPAAMVVAAGIPLLYYGVLERGDAAWRYGGSIMVHHPPSLWSILLPLAPLLLASVPAYFTPAKSFLAAATRVWLPAALLVWALSRAGLQAGAPHAWTGITIPLAVLAVEGVQLVGLRRVWGYRWIAWALVIACTIPATIQMMRETPTFIGPATHNQNLLNRSEMAAFRYLSHDPRPGGVLSTYHLGDAVPGETGRRTYVGDYRWSGPGYEKAERLSWEVLHGWIRGPAARAFVRSAGARFVLADCTRHADLASELAPVAVHRFGCATVYELR